MNRRDFLKLLAMLGGAATFGKVKLMATNGQLLARLARGDKLLESEVQQLERAIDGYDNYSSILQSNTAMGGRELNIPFPIANLYSQTLDSAVASINVPIPAQYNHFMIIGSGRSDVGAVGAGLGFVIMRFNGDTDSNYAYTYDGVQSDTFDKGQATSSALPIVGQFPGTTLTAQSTGYLFGFVSNLRSNIYWKSFIVLDGSFFDSGVASENAYGIWKSTNPVTEINLTIVDSAATAANFVAGSTISVFGLI